MAESVSTQVGFMKENQKSILKGVLDFDLKPHPPINDAAVAVVN